MIIWTNGRRGYIGGLRLSWRQISHGPGSPTNATNKAVENMSAFKALFHPWRIRRNPLSARAENELYPSTIQAELDPSYEEKDTDGAPTIPAGVSGSAFNQP
jgi:hypothetical protein